MAFGTAAVFSGEALQRPGNAAACDLLFRWLRPVRSTSHYSRGALCVEFIGLRPSQALNGHAPAELAPGVLV